MASLVARPADIGIVASLARVLMKLAGESKGSIGIVTLFHAVNEPNISIGEYITRIARYAGCSTECFVLCFVYINRILKHHKNFVISVLNIHRLVITSVMVAAKFYDDLYYSNSFYAKIGGVKTTEINLLEAHFLSLIEFDLYVSGADYEICRSKVANSEWWSMSCTSFSKILNGNSQWNNKNKTVYSYRSDSLATTLNDSSDGFKSDKTLQRMDTTFSNRSDFLKNDKLQHLQKLNHGQREKYQYNIARYNESFGNRYANDLKSRTAASFDNHTVEGSSGNINSSGMCQQSNQVGISAIAPPPCGVIGGPPNTGGNNIYEMIGNGHNNPYPPAFKFNTQQQQVKQQTQLLDRCYSLQSIPTVSQKQQYQYGVNNNNNNSQQQVRHLQQLQLWQMQSHRRDTIERQTRNIQNTSVIQQHRNHIPPYPCQQQQQQQQKHNRQAQYGYNNIVGGHNKSINKIVRRDIESWAGEVREKPQYRRSITRHVSDRPVPIGCPSFQVYDY